MTVPNVLLRHLPQSVLIAISMTVASPALAAPDFASRLHPLSETAVSVTPHPELQAALDISIDSEASVLTAENEALKLVANPTAIAKNLDVEKISVTPSTASTLQIAESPELGTIDTAATEEVIEADGATPQPDAAAETEAVEPEVDEVTAEPIELQDDVAESKETSESEETQESEEEGESARVLTPEELAKQQMLIEADNLFTAGDIEAAEALYRQAKDPFFDTAEAQPRAEAFSDPAQLTPGGKVFWRESAAGLEKNLKTRALVPGKLLIERHPEFVPGYLRYAKALRTYNQLAEGLAVLERGAARHPNQPDLQQGLIDFQVESKRWLEASITARQFALLNPDHPRANEFMAAAEEYQTQFRKVLRSQVTSNAIGGVITGALNVALTGNPFNAVSTIQSSMLLLRGEDSVGRSATKRAKKRFDMIEDPEVQAYVNRIGNKLVAVTGRELEYEFNIIKDENLNAFALPGGKIFINGGAITKSKSEAELAGLIAHELSHSVLSHGFQLVTDGNATSGLTSLLPFGSLFTGLALTDYSRDMEEQADLLGTRMLTSAGYAADGLRNLMVTIGEEQSDSPKKPEWLSSHPGNEKRVNYLEELIEQNGYNRYTYEGVAEHLEMQERVQAILDAPEEEDEEKALDDEAEDLKDQQAADAKE
ncbi:Beta-barrel assembly-enhancing protease [Acaryochloris thomasi RCC1774]|uniref:Beta-barrel assembly-enhancing protease n=1 Tax=Acaryochloris thomasi RCC1774 TaxID=1764569 RepID=A0A2W1JF38_9CYAN|nr:M48 family metallopeptidase [Acaryochloris thomasi]PZD70345.1 Beta-barrel assembly-enhancing protease [Acaryochloris thomasi RCC1774]